MLMKSDLKGSVIKKALSAKSCAYRYHNKNNTGGNFAIDIRGVNGKNYELSGDYDTLGHVHNLRFGYLYEVGIKLRVLCYQSFNNCMDFLRTVVKLGDES